jgi:uncharacterized membrane protein (DUF4010 family)
MRAGSTIRRVLDIDLALRFAAALGLGILLGLEREHTHHGDTAFGGVRTFALLTLLGAAAAYIEIDRQLTWMPIAVLLAVVALLTASFLITAPRTGPGITTEVSALLALLIGGLCIWGHVALAGAITVAAVALLALKGWLHHLADRIERADIEATLKFAIITLIILPLLPHRSFGPDDLKVINPYQIWLMVVLISAINFVSYILVKVMGPEHSMGLTGLLGGLVSSTAVTLGFAQRSRKDPQHSRALALGILIAWTVMLGRVAVLVFVVRPSLGILLAPRLALVAAVSLASCAVLARGRKRTPETSTIPSPPNPFELTSAIRFGLLFGAITFVAKAAERYLGAAGLYLTGGIAGLTDVDAITLSMADLAGRVPESTAAAARTVLIAILANTGLKAGMAAALGNAELRRSILPPALLLIAAGVVAIFLI